MRHFLAVGRGMWMVLMAPLAFSILAVTVILTTPLLFMQLVVGRAHGPADWLADLGTQEFRRVLRPWRGPSGR